MKYMLLMHGIEDEDDNLEDIPRTDEGEACWMPWFREMTGRGVEMLTGAMLMPSRTATTVRANGTEVLVADGPFAETKEQILGFDVIECADLDEAMYVASRHPVAQSGGVVEVRPVRAM
jgi:hypothetical protein